MPMYFNPAFTGIQQNLRLASPVRSQWNNSYFTTGISADMGFPKINSGFGLMTMHDEAGSGILITNSVSLSYASEIKLGTNSYLRIGGQAGIFQKTLNLDQLRFGDHIDPKLGFIYSTQEKLPTGASVTSIYPDFALGALFYNQTIYAGLSTYNLFQPQQSFFGSENSHLLRRYVGQFGGFWPVDEVTLNPNILFMNQGIFSQVLMGINAQYGKFTAGTSFRMTNPNADAVNFLLGFQTGIFKICYSYDLTVSAPRDFSGGSHELSIIFQWNKPRDTSGKPMVGHLMKAY